MQIITSVTTNLLSGEMATHSFSDSALPVDCGTAQIHGFRFSFDRL